MWMYDLRMCKNVNLYSWIRIERQILWLISHTILDWFIHIWSNNQSKLFELQSSNFSVDFSWCLVLTMHFVRQKCKFKIRTRNLINLRIERQILQIYFLGILISRNSKNREQFYWIIYYFHVAFKILFPFVWLFRSKWLIL